MSPVCDGAGKIGNDGSPPVGAEGGGGLDVVVVLDGGGGLDVIVVLDGGGGLVVIVVPDGGGGLVVIVVLLDRAGMLGSVD